MEKLKDAGARLGIIGGLTTAIGMTALMLAGPASATPTDPVETAFNDLEGKVTLYGAAVVALVVASVVLFFGIKFLKRGSNKA